MDRQAFVNAINNIDLYLLVSWATINKLWNSKLDYFGTIRKLVIFQFFNLCLEFSLLESMKWLELRLKFSLGKVMLIRRSQVFVFRKCSFRINGHSRILLLIFKHVIMVFLRSLAETLSLWLVILWWFNSAISIFRNEEACILNFLIKLVKFGNLLCPSLT